jgi:DNA-binding transcriptional MerR regulator
VFRIGEVAKLSGLTTRTLRYWEELGLVSPSSHRDSGERLYTREDMTRVARIRDLQKLLGFSLAEVRVVLETEEINVLNRVKAEFSSGDLSLERRRDLIDEAIIANDQLMDRLDDTLSHIQAFRAARVASAKRLRSIRKSLDAEETATSEVN